MRDASLINAGCGGLQKSSQDKDGHLASGGLKKVCMLL
jgi:hypothetical protein